MTYEEIVNREAESVASYLLDMKKYVDSKIFEYLSKYIDTPPKRIVYNEFMSALMKYEMAVEEMKENE